MASSAITGSFQLRRFAVSRVAARISSPELACLIVGSFIVRAFTATLHVAPILFPDEYIYGALGRSIAANGQPTIRGEAAHFPALLAPIVAAPLWGAFSSTMDAYHAVQVENAFFMSLAAIPVFLIARWLDIGRGFALFAAAVAVLSPDMGFAGYVLAEPLSYPLALTALYLGMRALESPSRSRQLAFLIAVGLTCFARAQYVVLLPAFLLAAACISGRGALRAHRLPFVFVSAGGLAVLLAGSLRFLGYYSAVADLHIGLGLLRWGFVDIALLSLAAGVAIVPGAIAGFVGARDAREGACAVLCATYTAALLVAAGLYASNGSGRFQERYLFSVLPLLAIGFGLYVKHGKARKWTVVGLSSTGILLAATFPISRYAGGTGPTDSPTLRAIARLEETIGIGTTSLGIALYITVATLLAAALAWNRFTWPLVALTVGFLLFSSTASTAFDIVDVRKTFESASSPDPRWVDEQHLQGVVAIHTLSSPPWAMLQKLFFNRSISRELVLAPGTPTDSFNAPFVRIAPDGTLHTNVGVVDRPMLFEKFGMTATFDNARLVAETKRFSLWKPDAHAIPRLRFLERGRYDDGWLASLGRLTVYAPKGAYLHGIVTMTLSGLSQGAPVPFTIAGRSISVKPGERIPLRFCVRSRGPWAISFSGRPQFLPDLRAVTIHSTRPRFDPRGNCTSPSRFQR